MKLGPDSSVEPETGTGFPPASRRGRIETGPDPMGRVLGTRFPPASSPGAD